MADGTSFVNLLNRSGKYLSQFLKEYLPKIDYDWWDYRVLNSLPDFAKRKVEITGNLDDLDIAALLKVFDANWRDLSKIANLEFVILNYAKELMSIRNKWAHQTASGIEPEIIERHLSTLYQFSKGIGADQTFLTEVQECRTAILQSELGIELEKSVKVETNTNSCPICNHGDIEKGMVVHLKANPSMKGVVIDIASNGAEIRYSVFVKDKIQFFYKSQIELESQIEAKHQVSLSEFNAYLTATQLNSQNSQAIFSRNSAKIDFVPYQFRPVLKFLKSDRPRLLIADGVGVGKTIEAGLILKELEARSKEPLKVLIICPKPLVSEHKWAEEMKIRFNESFTSLDGKMFREAIDDAALDVWSENLDKVIIPYSILTEDNLKSRHGYTGLLDLPYPPEFDLVIVDEAHHIRNPNTWSNKGVRFFIDNAKAAILLTATPIQMGEDDLFNLLNVIRPDIIGTKEVFKDHSEPNPYINQAISLIRSQKTGWQKDAISALRMAESTAWGMTIYPENPIYNKVIETLGKSELTEKERVSLLTDVESLHTFSSIISRTRRRDIGTYSIRKSETFEAELGPEQREVYDEILSIQEEILSKISPGTPLAFMMSTLYRRASSCLPALVPFLHRLLTRHLAEYDFAELECDNTQINLSSYLSKRIEDIIKKANNLPKDDEKYDNLRQILAETKDRDIEKVMIFSSFRGTLSYLANRLVEDGYRVGVIHGDVEDIDRRHLRSIFSLPKSDESAIDILLFSDVGCEGLDYQFCNCLVNYDIPWNPMKIEQRIGRIDRTGQKSDTVFIFNLITSNTIDAEIYNRCLKRIGIFESSIGENEIILLGDISAKIKEICDAFDITEDERNARLDQLADNEIRSYVEKEKLAENMAEILGVALPKLQMEQELESATSSFLSPVMIENLVNTYLTKRLDNNGVFILHEKSGIKLRLKEEYRNIIYDDFLKTYKENSRKKQYSKWRRWLEGKDLDHGAFYPISFNTEESYQDESEVVNTGHPLVRQAIESLKPGLEITTSITVEDSTVKQGKYPFAIYLWEYLGEHPKQELIPITTDSNISQNLTRYFQDGNTSEEEIEITDAIRDELDKCHYIQWTKASKIHKDHNIRFISGRKESIKRSFKSQIATIDSLITVANDKNIIQMRLQEKNNKQRAFEEDMRNLDDAESKAEIVYTVIGYGTVVVK